MYHVCVGMLRYDVVLVYIVLNLFSLIELSLDSIKKYDDSFVSILAFGVQS